MAKGSYTPVSGALRGFVALRDRFVDGSDSPEAFLKRCVKRIKRREKTVNAFTELDLKRAQKQAKAASQRYAAGAPLSLVDGCPVAIKDIIHTERLTTGMGSPIYRGWSAPTDATCVAALREAGAIIVGKTHTTEFAVGASPPTTNPWRHTCTPGGSSSGSAAAGGDGMLPIAIGTQTVGSILRPASYCGAIGFKPSLGAISTAGVHPLSATLDHVGPIAASVQDAWAAAMTMQWAYGGEASIGSAWFDPVEAARPARLARLDQWVGAEQREPGVQDAFDAFVDGLERRGVAVQPVSASTELATLAADANAMCLDIMRYEMRHPLGMYLRRHPDLIGGRIKEHLQHAADIDVLRYRQRLEQRQALRAAVAAVDVDGFILPAANGTAPKGLAFTGERTMLAPWSVVGGPAWSLPLLALDGMPLGVQLAGAPGRDTQLAGIAAWLMAEDT